VMKTLKLTAILVVALALVAGAAGCDTGSPSSLNETEVRAYADPATETTLQGLSEANLEKYVQNGNAEFKAAVTQDPVDQVAAQVAGSLGSYVSIDFLRMEQVEGYVVVHYKTHYTEGEVGVRIAFDGDGLVAGQFFE
jgi:hypothetical protein